jgi:hypothetical protein
MFAPRVTRHTSIRYSSSCHTRVNMGATIFFTAAMIRANTPARSRGNGGMYVRPTLATWPRWPKYGEHYETPCVSSPSCLLSILILFYFKFARKIVIQAQIMYTIRCQTFRTQSKLKISYNGHICNCYLKIIFTHNLYVYLRPGWRYQHSDALRAGGSGDRITVKARISVPVQPSPGAHRFSCTVGNVSFWEVKRQERDADRPFYSKAEGAKGLQLSFRLYLCFQKHVMSFPL